MAKNRTISSGVITDSLRYSLPRVDARRHITSTNTVLKELGLAGAPDGYLLTADQQTEGRGRLGRSFASPACTGIYMSLLLREEGILENPARITATAAVAVSVAVEKVCGVKTGVKWVNDLFVHGKKVCGILAEGCATADPFAVLGIGVNVFRPRDGFGELSDIADGILPYREDTSEIRSRLVAEIVNEFYDRFRGDKRSSVYSEYRERLFILGRDITVRRGDDVLTLRAVDIAHDFRLLVEHPSGEREYLSCGEISIISF